MENVCFRPKKQRLSENQKILSRWDIYRQNNYDYALELNYHNFLTQFSIAIPTHYFIFLYDVKNIIKWVR